MTIFLVLLAAMILFMSIVWFIAIQIDDFSIVDIAWGLTFIVTAVTTLILTANYNATSLTILVLVLIWGLRLSGYLFYRNVGKPEDYRYQNMRKKWNHPNRTAFYRVFMLQGALSLFFSLPIIIGIANSSSDSVTSILIIGAALWAFGFLFETVGDAQLDRFKKKENKDHRFIQHGLWKYTRHPNYFGESVQWFAIALIAATVPWGWITFISPIILTFFLLKISGVPLLEKKFMEHEEYREYAARTNKFVPGPPKN